MQAMSSAGRPGSPLSTQGTSARRLPALAVGVTLAALTVAAWLAVRALERDRRVADAEHIGSTAARLVTLQLRTLHAALARLDEQATGPCDEVCEREIGLLLRDMPEILELGWLGTLEDSDVLFLRGTAAAGAVGPTPGGASIEEHLDRLRSARAGSGPRVERVGSYRISLSFVSPADGRRMIAVVDVPQMMRRIGDEQVHEPLAIHVNDEQVFTGARSTQAEAAAVRQSLFEAEWIFATPVAVASAWMPSAIVLALGLLLALAASALTLVWPGPSIAEAVTSPVLDETQAPEPQSAFDAGGALGPGDAPDDRSAPAAEDHALAVSPREP